MKDEWGRGKYSVFSVQCSVGVLSALRAFVAKWLGLCGLCCREWRKRVGRVGSGKLDGGCGAGSGVPAWWLGAGRSESGVLGCWEAGFGRKVASGRGFWPLSVRTAPLR